MLDSRAAMRCALDQAAPGDLVTTGCASRASKLQQALSGVAYAAVDPASLGVVADEGPAHEVTLHHRVRGERPAQRQACGASLRLPPTRLL